MKSLIKREGSQEFLTEDGRWTDDLAQAKVFPSVTALHEESRRRGLQGVEHYVLQRDTISSLDFSFPERGRNGVGTGSVLSIDHSDPNDCQSPDRNAVFAIFTTFSEKIAIRGNP